MPDGGRIPFNRPPIAGEELRRISEALESGQLAGDGPFTERCEALLLEELGVAGVLLTPSGTAALEMAALLVGLEPGDEVIGPSFTFPSTLGAFTLFGARPVFADIHPDTLNLDEREIEGLISERTRAIVCTHYGGVGCELDALDEIAEQHSLALVEDNAHGLFGSYRGRPLGSFGRFGALSFHETKNLSSGEGGALLLTDRADLERAEIIREKGTNRSAFHRGQVDRYTWVDIGSSYLPSELQAAMLWAQLDAREAIQAERKRIWERYAEGLADWAGRCEVQLPTVPNDREHPAHVFQLILPSEAARDRFIEHLRSREVVAVFHYLPLHTSPMGRRLAEPRELPVTEDVAGRLARLPLYYGLSEDEQATVIDAVLAFEP
jgi:dTDP-4-amino-4,6-dideoxygalactose transaminase